MACVNWCCAAFCRREIWAKNKSMNCEELMLVQANKIKTASPTTRAWVYRNAIKVHIFGRHPLPH